MFFAPAAIIMATPFSFGLLVWIVDQIAVPVVLLPRSVRRFLECLSVNRLESAVSIFPSRVGVHCSAIRHGRLCVLLFRLTAVFAVMIGKTRFGCLAGWSRQRSEAQNHLNAKKGGRCMVEALGPDRLSIDPFYQGILVAPVPGRLA